MSIQSTLANRVGQKLVVGFPYLWLLLLVLLPFFLVLKISFSEQAIAIPPYVPLVTTDPDMGSVLITLNYLNYTDIFSNFFSSLGSLLNPFGADVSSNIYLQTYFSSLKIAVITTLLCLLFGYPIAYAIAHAKPHRRNGLLLLIMLPFWTSFLLRVYAWMGLLSTNGLINNWLMSAGFIDKPIDMFYNQFSLILVMVYGYLPFMILPLYTQLLKHDPSLLEAASDLGAGPIKSFLTITLPLSRAGIVAGSMLVFIPAVGEYVVPELVGGPENLMIGKVLWNAFFDQNNWPLASAIAVIMVLLLILPISLFHRYENRELQRKANA